MKNETIIKVIGYFLLIFNLLFLPFTFYVLYFYINDISFPLILKILSAITLFAHILNIFLGYGFIKLKEWARRIFIYFSIFGLILSPLSFAIFTYHGLIDSNSIVGSLVGCIFNIALLLYFTRKNVKKLFK